MGRPESLRIKLTHYPGVDLRPARARVHRALEDGAGPPVPDGELELAAARPTGK